METWGCWGTKRSASPKPTHSQEHSKLGSARAQAWGATGRALIAGYVDSYTLLNFGVYASFMSGNTTSAGLHIGQASAAAAAHSLLPIPFFVFGIFMWT